MSPMAISKLIIFSTLMNMVSAANSKLRPYSVTSEGIVGESLIRMCVGMWDDAEGLIGLIERIAICSKVLPMTR